MTPVVDHPTAAPAPGTAGRLPEVVLLSSLLLTDRMIFYSRALPILQESARVRVWATSAANPQMDFAALNAGAVVEPMPEILPFREFPHNYARRLNEMVWDYAQRTPSRMSIRKHLPERNGSPMVRALKGPALALAALRVQQPLENWLERLLLKYPRSVEAEERFRRLRPAAVVCTGPHRYEEPAIVAAAKRQGVPVLAMITSWDNITTKNRLMFQYDGYIVWSPQMRRELHEFYPQTRGKPAYEIGAPQFDVFFQDEFRESREEFCARHGLRPDRPIILHALGSPNFIPGEYHAALHLADRVAKGELGDVQMLIRPHPLFETGEETKPITGFGPRVVVQRTGQAGTKLTARSQDRQQILDWVSTFRHCDVLVNLFSTVAIDAAIFDKPVVNLDYDPSPERKRHAMIKDVNHVWSHFKPLTESGAMWTVQNNDEMVAAVKGYLAAPELHREKRRWMAEYVCGHLDGRCGERLARAILDFVQQREAGIRQSRSAAA